MMKRFLGTMTTVAALFSAAHALAEPVTPVARREVAQLLDFVARSDCQFKRNGSWYDAGKARAHLQEKYDYLEHRGKIPNAEAFIELAASTSSMSGKPYEVRCGNRPVQPSGAWLSDELKRLRSGGR